MAEELVPQGLPHGERQNQESAMRQAGLALDLPQRPTPTAAPAPRQAATRNPSADILQRRSPTRPFGPPDPMLLDPRSRLRQMRDTTPNLFVAALLTRFLEESEG